MQKTGSQDSKRLARRDAIAQGALSVLGGLGGRGLTHRAVDRQLALPQGSTSYYFNTRTKLLLAALEALFESDKNDVLRLTDADGRIDSDELLALWTSPARRERLLARLELFLEASRNAAVRARIKTQRARFVQMSTASAVAKGASDPQKAAAESLARFDSELLRHAAFGDLD